MRTNYTVTIALLAGVLGLGIGRTVVTAQSEKTVWSGIYTSEQATRGKDKAAMACGACHGAALNGGDLAPTLSGMDFIGHWYDAKLSELVSKVTVTMPADAPGSLKPAEYADVIAYLLQLNGFPAGQETLVVEPVATLDAVKITKAK
jgi:S-disulfanyl-L-cysteine oxidoreductase SoxD